MTETGIVNIRGKEYQTVALRVKEFRAAYPKHAIRTQIIDISESIVLMKAEVWDGEYLVATGHAEENRKSSNVNKTSALENCETSAIGRALASYGFGGTEFASADEMKGTIDCITEDQLDTLSAFMAENDLDPEPFLNWAKIKLLRDLPASKFDHAMSALRNEANKKQREPGGGGVKC